MNLEQIFNFAILHLNQLINYNKKQNINLIENRTRTRICNNPPQSGTGAACSGLDSNSEVCTPTTPCPIGNQIIEVDVA